jgi:hypothetical protein
VVALIIIAFSILLFVFIAAVVYLAVLDEKDETDDLRRSSGKMKKS